MSNNTYDFKKYEYRPNDLVLGRYRVIKRFEGGMTKGFGFVYKAEDTSFKEGEYFSDRNKYVAIKVINRNEGMDDDT
jgi:serine/threonine protein kinase